MKSGRWKVRLAAPASADFRDALRFTRTKFGIKQVAIYRASILAALHELRDGPDVLGSRPRDDLSIGGRTLHIARRSRRGRHVIVYRVEIAGTVEVVRILHDAMDLARHIAPVL